MVNFAISFFRHIRDGFFLEKVNHGLDRNGYYKFKSMKEKKRYQEYYTEYNKVSSNTLTLVLLYRVIYICNISMNFFASIIVANVYSEGYLFLCIVINIVIIIVVLFYVIQPAKFKNKRVKIPLLLLIPTYSSIIYLYNNDITFVHNNLYIIMFITLFSIIILDLLMNSIRKKQILKNIDPTDELVILYEDYEI